MNNRWKWDVDWSHSVNDAVSLAHFTSNI